MAQTRAPGKTRMQAIVQDTYGSTEVLALRDIDKPVPRRTRCWCGWRRPAWTGASCMS
jgi:hypothetical protein